ncbi:MAG: biotin--[acetyl-CoA-carboxylase] ligase [Chloroflexota bacterium]
MIDTNNFDINLIKQVLQNELVGHHIAHYQSILTTMDIARGLADADNTRSGTVVVAEEQTQGRGRQQRYWQSIQGKGLWLTIILKPPYLPRKPTTLPMLAGVAVVRAIRAIIPIKSKHTVSLKWPNDVLISMPNIANQRGEASQSHKLSYKKVGGILIETVLNSSTTHSGDSPFAYALIGIGLNVNHTTALQLPKPPVGTLSPTSLALALGKPVDRTHLFVQLCQEMSTLLADDEHEIYQTWRSSLATIGEFIRLYSLIQTREPETYQEEPSWRGRVVDVTEEGSLVLLDDDGVEHIFTSGDVTTNVR